MKRILAISIFLMFVTSFFSFFHNTFTVIASDAYAATSSKPIMDAKGWGQICDKGSCNPCTGPDQCKTQYGIDAPFCDLRPDSNGFGWCQPLNPNPTATNITATFPSPTGEDKTFADLLCSVTSFISDTILPPLAVLMMLAVGFMFLTSGGAPQKSSAAQKALLFTVAGVFVLLLAPGIVVLIGDLFSSTSLRATSCASQVTTGAIIKSFIGLVNWFSWFVAITSVAMGLYSGFLYLTARDDPAQATKAAKVLSYVIIGVAVSILAFSIITIVKQFVGLAG